jgi:phospholipid/cholesterol/gamma-HCH transport system substrate-binding protein
VKPVVSKALAVGVLTAVVGVAFLVTITFIRTGGYSERDSYLVYAYFKDATGLTWKSKLQIAGIQVGEVDQIGLDGPRARLGIRVKKGIELHADACFTKTYPSALLPDAVLEAQPGSADSPRLADLPEAEREVKCVREAATVQQVTDLMAAIATDIRTITSDLAQTVSGDEGMRQIVENLARVTARVDQVVDQNGQRLSDILENTRGFTGDLAEISSRDKERIHVIARNLEELTRRLNYVVASVQDVVDPGGGPPGAGPGQGGAPPAGEPGAPGPAAPGGTLAARQPGQTDAQGVKQAVERLSTSMARLDSLIAKVDEGKSVAGKLLVDEKLGRKVGSAVEGAADYYDRLTKLQVQLNLRSEWLLNQSIDTGTPGTKIYFAARLLPRPDKFYLIELVSDPRGVDTIVTETITPENGAPTTYTKRTNEEKLTFSAQVGKRYGAVTFRAGIIEGSGGVGSDLHLLRDRLQLSASVYQFSRIFQNQQGNVEQSVYPRAKLWVNWYFWDHFYLTTGADDFLNRWQTGRLPGGRQFSVGTDLFFGGGLYFTDEDLKTLLGAGLGSVAGGQ